jgi:hypothetical protein
MTTNRTEETTKGLRASRGATIGVIAVVCFLGWLFAEPPPNELDIIAEKSQRRLVHMKMTTANLELDDLIEREKTVGLTAEEAEEKAAIKAELEDLRKQEAKMLRLD